MSYKVAIVQCPNCGSECEGVYEFQDNNIKKLVGVNCWICGFKKKIEEKNVAGEKSQKVLI